MQFSPQFLDELRSRLRPSEVIGRYVTLKSKGRGEHVGLCAFHNDSSPSMTVSDEKGFYHCFACGAHGDIIKFLMEKKGLSFLEAVTELAETAGMALPRPDPEAERRYQKMLTLYDVMDAACRWFEEQLQLSHGAYALDYLKHRGIDPKTRQTFRIGYAPNGSDGLKRALLGKGITERQLVDTGLVITPEERGKASFDRFRDRIMFPIRNSKGKVVAFGGRALSADAKAKYLNSPETELFHKGKLLYNFDLARENAYREGTFIVAEGYMDVIALHKAGFTHAVAPLGTAITPFQLERLWSIVKEPILCLDGDEAGGRAMARTAELALPLLKPGHSLRFSLLPEGEDPDDVIVRHGKKTMKSLLDDTIPLATALWDIAYHSTTPKTPEQSAAFEQTLMKMVEQIKDPTVQNYYRKYFQQMLWEHNRRRAGKKEPSVRRSSKLGTTQHLDIPALQRYERLLVAIIVNHPKLLQEGPIEEECNYLNFLQQDLQEVVAAIVEHHSNNEQVTVDSLREYLEIREMTHHIAYVDDDTFLDDFARKNSKISVARAGWQYVLACYQFSLMEAEYEKKAASLTGDEDENVWELKKQKDSLMQTVEKHKHDYEEMLDAMQEG